MGRSDRGQGGSRRSGWVGAFAAVLVVALIGPTLGASAVSAQDEPPDTTTTTRPVESTSTLPPTTVTSSIPAPTTTIGPTSTTAVGPTTTGPDDTTTTTTTPDETTTTIGGVPVPIAPPPGISVDQAQVDALLRGYDEAVSSEASLLAYYEIYVQQIEDLNQTLALIDDRIDAVERDMASLEVELAEAEGEAAVSRVYQAQADEDLAEARVLLEEQLVEAYITGGTETGLIGALLDADSIDEVQVSQEYVQAIIEHSDGIIGQFLEVQAEAAEREADAEREEADAQVVRDELAERRAALDVQLELQAVAQANALEASLIQSDLIAQVNAARGDYENRLRTLQAGSTSIAQIIQGNQIEQSLTTIDFKFLPPVRNGAIVSPFGNRLHPIFGTYRQHNGLDIDAGSGTPIRAGADGVVIVAGSQGGYGNTVVIDHLNGLATLYAHQSSTIAQVGDVVAMGDIIGLVGSTGYSTGPHLHWEVRVFGTPVNPIDYLGTEQLLLDHQVEQALASTTTTTSTTVPGSQPAPTTSTDPTGPGG